MNFKKMSLAAGLMMLSLVFFTTGCGSTTSVGTSGSSSTTVKVTQIAARNNGTHTLFLKSDGTVWATGSNTTGQLGNGTTTGASTPVKVLLEDGTTALTGVIAVTTGSGSGASASGHSMALKSDGTVWIWGANATGQLGDGSTTQRNNPVQVAGLSGVTAIAGGAFNNVTSEGYSIALKSDETVWAWGANSSGQLGDGTTTNHSAPAKVQLASGGDLTGISAISAGNGHAIALKSDGTVWAWGKNGNGQCGANTAASSLPAAVQVVKDSSNIPLTNITTIASGGGFCLAIDSSKNLWVWGQNSSGQLGDGTTANSGTAKQVSLSGVIAVANSGAHALVLTTGGIVSAWGSNDNGQVGDETTTNRTSPVTNTTLSGIAFTSVAGGGSDSFALQADGTVYAWGKNGFGELGDGTTTGRLTPVKIPSF